MAEMQVFAKADERQAVQVISSTPADGVAVLSTRSNERRDEFLRKLNLSTPAWSYSPGDPTGLQLEYETPQTLGVDRVAAAAGAHAIYPSNACLVIDAGTCITYEFVSETGVYKGGNISPGLRMRLAAMNHFTGKLPLVEFALPDREIGFSTASALQNGALRGAIYELQHYVSAFRQNHPQGKVLVCGGDSPFLRPHLPSGTEFRSSLVLEGLAKLHEYAQHG